MENLLPDPVQFPLLRTVSALNPLLAQHLTLRHNDSVLPPSYVA